MNFVVIFILFTLFKFIYTFFLHRMIDKQRQLPLPECVSDVYEPERYQTFLDYSSDTRKLSYIFLILTTILEFGLIFAGFYKWVDVISHGNEYLVVLYSTVSVLLISCPIDYIHEYLQTFKIEEKYHQNKKTKKEFNKDFLLEFPLYLASILLTFLFIAIVHFIAKANFYPMSIYKALLIAIIIVCIVLVALFLITLLSLLIMRKTYTFTEMEDNELRQKITSLLKGVKKKIYHIYIYNESKKSISKNAFVLHLLFYREISIADNFITENAEDELLGVIAHEVGHLKHKKTLLEYLSYSLLICLFFILTYCIYNPQLLIHFVSWVNTSFGITTTNYNLLVTAISTFMTPILFLSSLFSNYISRKNEYEADVNAVKEGYGEALIKTFKELSHDELIDVNPCKWIEITKYNHPGMVNRINAIYNEEKKFKEERAYAKQ